MVHLAAARPTAMEKILAGLAPTTLNEKDFRSAVRRAEEQLIDEFEELANRISDELDFAAKLDVNNDNNE